MTTHCNTCGGEIGVFCFNPVECAEITRQMQEHYAAEDQAQLQAELSRLRSSNEASGWKIVPKEATRELLSDASSKQAGDKQVLCYEGGSYYNAWLVFDEYEGGWIWMNEADSEPNPSHYRLLPAPPVRALSLQEEEAR